MTQRNQQIDIARGIGIILVVVAHAGMPYGSVINHFHMALFFFLSGLTVSDRYITSARAAGTFLLRRVKGLYVPFVLFNGAFYLAYNQLLRLNILTDNPAFLQPPAVGGGNGYGIVSALSGDELGKKLLEVLCFQGESQLGGALWFLRVLMGVACTWCVLNWLIKSVLGWSDEARRRINIALGFVFLMLSDALSARGAALPGQYETVMSSYLMYVAGVYFGKTRRGPLSAKRAGTAALLALAALLLCSRLCARMGWNCSVNELGNPYLFLLTSALGITASYAFAALIARWRWSAAVSFLGRHSLFILIFQFAAFKLVTLLQCGIYGLPLYRLASFPVLESGRGWWLAYSAVGLLAPAALSVLWSRCKRGGKRLLTALCQPKDKGAAS